MEKVNTPDLSKYIAERLTSVSAKDIEFNILRPRRLSHFEIEMMRAHEELLIKKIKEES